MTTTETEKKDAKLLVLDAYLQGEEAAAKPFTSIDVCDNLRDTIPLEPQEVTEYLLDHGWLPKREGDGIVWVRE